MSYRDFTLGQVKKVFSLKTVEAVNIFAGLPLVESSAYLSETLEYNVPLALASNSEKARSEMVIAPILIEVRKQLQGRVSLFSGVKFTVQPELGLDGYCDFILSQGSEQLLIMAPVVMMVEAKNENLKAGLGQCIAEMVAAQRFNQQQEQPIREIYGAVTTGTNGRFLKLLGNEVQIDLRDYYLSELTTILGILVNGIQIQLPAFT